MNSLKMLIVLLLFGSITLTAETKFEKDKEAIKALTGCYKVSFEFAETFAPDTNYKFKDRMYAEAVEQVILVDETENKISLQHILIADGRIVKHWRQDWIYENNVLFEYYKDNKWIKKTYTDDEVKGTWTQKVYQVDDSPRYESFGTWVHLNGKTYWESTCDAPLPRRERKIRDDYNVMRRHNRFELTEYGWIFEQDNQKIIRSDEGDQLLAWEKGFEKFAEGDYDCTLIQEWWSANKDYWQNVRSSWEEVYSAYDIINLKHEVDGTKLYERLFGYGNDLAETEVSSQDAEVNNKIKSIIDEHFIKD